MKEKNKRTHLDPVVVYGLKDPAAFREFLTKVGDK
jgi:hypothetical protein